MLDAVIIFFLLNLVEIISTGFVDSLSVNTAVAFLKDLEIALYNKARIMFIFC